ncbi:MAG: hypothetical protein IJ876_08310 [Elusimicrobiaceae bacterium]|nr:hypothetical protein [Elusimicrobiaceae bacterium]
MTILIILALIALVVVYAVFFLLCKVGWLIFKSHSNKGPLITAGVCTVLVAVLITIGTWLTTRAILAPFQGIMARVQKNPAPVYGEHTYQDATFPFELTVYNGMDFADWITLGDVQLKLGMDTNTLKKDASGKAEENFLIAAIIRQTNVKEKDPFEVLQEQLQAAQAQRQLLITAQERTLVNGLPAYQTQGEGYSNRGKLNFWLTALQSDPQTLYYIGALSMNNTPELAQQALDMENSFHMITQ